MKMRKGQIWLGVIFVILGALLILKNFGFVSQSVWGFLWKFWPLILVLIGLEMVISNKLVRGIIVIVFLLIGIGLVAFSGKEWKRPQGVRKEVVQTADSSIQKFIIREDLKDIKNLEIVCENIKKLDITVSSKSGKVLDATLSLMPGKENAIFVDSIDFLVDRTGPSAVLRLKDRREFWKLMKGYIGDKGYEGTLEVQIPKGLNLTVRNINGDIRILEFEGKELRANLVNGDINFQDIESSLLKIEMVNGGIYLRDVQSSDAIELSKVNGQWDIDKLVSKSISISGVNGDVTLGGDMEFENLKVELVNSKIQAKLSKKWLKGFAVISTLNGTIVILKDGVSEVPLYVEKGLKKDEAESTAKAGARIIVKTVTGNVELK